MKVVYLECPHGVSKIMPCPKCESERQTMYQLSRGEAIVKDTRIPIYRGCNIPAGEGCFCTGRCKEIIGYYE